jgi:hypothetical protein
LDPCADDKTIMNGRRTATSRRRAALGALALGLALAGCASTARHRAADLSPSAGPAESSVTAAATDSPSSAATSVLRSHTAVPLPRPSSVAADAERGALASTLLAAIAVKGRAPKTGYARSAFGSAWTDDNDDPLGHNGCDTRNDVLRRDLSAVTIKPGTAGCVVLSGTLLDPYTGTQIAFHRGVTTSAQVQIDHVVALGDAWQTGAQYWPEQRRVDLANDPLELLAVSGPVNESKGDADAATWLPPNRAYRCAYVARQIAVKARYGLWMTAAEKAASQRVLASCPGQRAPTESGSPPALATKTSATSVAVPHVTHPPTRATAAPTVATAGPTARCKDGTYSYAKHHQGACSHHGGVAIFYH